MIPFPVIYFGTILFFFALDGKGIVKDLPAYDAFLDFKSSPTQSTAVLVSTSALVVVPLLGLWRAFLKRHVFSAMAERWAGLKPGSAVHEKFLEQAWLAMHYGLTTLAEAYVLHSKPWWPPVLSASANEALTTSQAQRELDQQDSGLQFVCKCRQADNSPSRRLPAARLLRPGAGHAALH
jgi:hypothetical protein